MVLMPSTTGPQVSVLEEQFRLITDFWSSPVKGLLSFADCTSDVAAVADSYSQLRGKGFVGELTEAAALGCQVYCT